MIDGKSCNGEIELNYRPDWSSEKVGQAKDEENGNRQTRKHVSTIFPAVFCITISLFFTLCRPDQGWIFRETWSNLGDTRGLQPPVILWPVATLLADSGTSQVSNFTSWSWSWSVKDPTKKKMKCPLPSQGHRAQNPATLKLNSAAVEFNSNWIQQPWAPNGISNPNLTGTQKHKIGTKNQQWQMIIFCANHLVIVFWTHRGHKIGLNKQQWQMMMMLQT